MCTRGGPGDPYECLQQGIGIGRAMPVPIRPRGNPATALGFVPGLGPVFSAQVAARLRADGFPATQGGMVRRLTAIATAVGRRAWLYGVLGGPVSQVVSKSSFDRVRAWLAAAPRGVRVAARPRGPAVIPVPPPPRRQPARLRLRRP